jgi:hypothetical protein
MSSGPVPPQRDPQPWGSPSGRPPQRNKTVLWVVLGVVLVLLVAGGGVGFYLWQRSKTDSPTSSAAASHSVATTRSGAPGAVAGGASKASGSGAAPTGKSVPGPGGLSEPQALAQLQQLRAQSLQRVVLDGRWVAQVASKNVGVTDPLQTALNGSHTFYAVDILAESQSIVSRVGDPTKVYVLWGTDFGKRSQAPDGSPYWTTIVDAGYASHDNVLAWCKVTFPELTPQQLADTCAPRQLTSPHN